MAELQKAPWSDWETVSLIGRGSFGTVYEIQRKLVGEDTESAALKVINIPQNPGDIEEMYSEGYDDESITATFNSHLKSIVAEYSLMRKMDGSANIVNCKDIRYIQHDDGIGWDIYIRMELLTPLMKALPVCADEATVIRIGKDICNALVLCKKHEIVHRDIKPQNIFVSPNGDYKLGDFGIAKTVEKTMGGTKIGTYKYMAPEVYNNQPYGSAADIYSLGLVLYWLLNERRMPFMPLPPAKPKAGQDEESRNRRLSGEKLPEPAHGSSALKQIVLKACAYDPKDRYSSAAAMLEDLNKLIGDASIISTIIIPEAKDEEKQEGDGTIGPVFGTIPSDNDNDGTIGPVFDPIPSGNDNDETLPKNDESTVEVKNEEAQSDVKNEDVTANSETKDTEEDKKKGKKTILLILLLLILLAVIATIGIIAFNGRDKDGKDTSGENESSAQVIESESDNTLALKIEGVVYKLPCDYQELTDAGWTISSTGYSDDKTIGGHSYDSFVMSNDGKAITVWTYNNSDESKAIKNCLVGGFTWRVEDGVEVEMAKGITISSTIAEIMSAFGTPTEYDDTNENVSLRYRQKDLESNEVLFECYDESSEGGKWSTISVSIIQKTFSMPNVVGKTKNDAEKLLNEKGLVVIFEYKKTDTVSEGTVLEQDISEGESVQKGDQVIITIASGRETIDVDDVVGMTKTNAEAVLNEQGFTVSVIEVYNSTVASGKVISQSPAAGTSQLPGSEITVYVSKGKQPKTLNFDANGGSVTTKNKTVYLSDVYGTLPTPTRTGFDFNGWFTAKTGGVKITNTSKVTTTTTQTLYARWTAKTYKASWNSGTGYSVTVKRTSSPYAGASTGNISSGTAVYYGDVLSVSYTANAGYTISKKGSTSITVSGNVTSSNIYATASVNSYTASWSNGTGYTITVKRTSSPYGGASTGNISSGATVYYGDVLSVSYTKKDYYTITSNGDTSITVTGNITSSRIYANASQNALSGWVLESQVPSGAQVVEEYWKYDKTTSYWGSWSSWSTTAVYSSSTREVNTKTVTDKAAYTTYRYWRYVNSAGTYAGTYGYNGCTIYQEINLDYALEFKSNSSGVALYGSYVYNGNTYLKNIWLFGEQTNHPAETHTEYQYRDLKYSYEYDLISYSKVTAGGEISNVRRYVRYRPK